MCEDPIKLESSTSSQSHLSFPLHTLFIVLTKFLVESAYLGLLREKSLTSKVFCVFDL